MLLGNVLRGILRRGGVVKIGKTNLQNNGSTIKE
jgi:hypothetical protein